MSTEPPSEPWVIQGKAVDALPVVGQHYEVRHTRKGTFLGLCTSVSGEWAEFEVVQGVAKAVMCYNVGHPGDSIDCRSGLCYLIEKEAPAPIAQKPIEGPLPVRVPDADVDKTGHYVGPLTFVGFRHVQMIHLRAGDLYTNMALCGAGPGYKSGWETLGYFGDRRPAICKACRNAAESARKAAL